jgi:hypothetical protein
MTDYIKRLENYTKWLQITVQKFLPQIIYFSTVQYSTVQYSTVQYSTVQTLDHLVHSMASPPFNLNKNVTLDLGMLPPEQYFNFYITDTVSIISLRPCKPVL